MCNVPVYLVCLAWSFVSSQQLVCCCALDLWLISIDNTPTHVWAVAEQCLHSVKAFSFSCSPSPNSGLGGDPSGGWNKLAKGLFSTINMILQWKLEAEEEVTVWGEWGMLTSKITVFERLAGHQSACARWWMISAVLLVLFVLFPPLSFTFEPPLLTHEFSHFCSSCSRSCPVGIGEAFKWVFGCWLGSTPHSLTHLRGGKVIKSGLLS